MRAPTRLTSLLLASLLAVPAVAGRPPSGPRTARLQQPKPRDAQDIGVRASITGNPQNRGASTKPEIVLQAGVTTPQTQVSFSPDARFLASMGVDATAVKLWEVSSGRLLRELENSNPTIGATATSRPFRFSADGQTLIAVSDGRVRRWDLDAGREISSIMLPVAKDCSAVILSEDGTVVAGANLNQHMIRLWSSATGRALPSVALDNDEDLAAQDGFALSPDGKLLAAFTQATKASRKGAETNQQVILWDVATGRKAQTLKVSSGPTAFGSSEVLASLVFSSDGVWLGLRTEGSIRIWEVAGGRQLKTLVSPKMIAANSAEPAFGVFASRFLFSPDRMTISVVSEGRRIDLIDASAGTTIRTLAGHNGVIIASCFSADGKLIATSGVDNQIKLWDASAGSELRAFSGAAMPVSDIAFSQNGKSLAVAGQRAINSWELLTGGVHRSVSIPEDYAMQKHSGIQEHGSVLSRDGRFVIAGSSTQPVAKVWDVATGREVTSVSLTQGKELGGAAFNGNNGAVAVIEKEPHSPIASSSQGAPQSLPNTPAQPIVMPDFSKMMEQMRRDPKKMQEQMKKAEEAMKKGDLGAGLSMLENMGVMAPANRAGRSPSILRIVDMTTGRQLQTIPLGGGFLNEAVANTGMSSSTLSFSPDGRILASAAGFNAPITLRDASTGQELRSLKTTLSMSVYGLAWSADGKRLASAHWGFNRNLADPQVAQSLSFEDMNFQIKVWDPDTGSELNTLAGHNNFVNALAFSRDGRVLASGAYDSTIKLWDLSTGREVRTLKGHAGPISALEFSADGRFLVSGSRDGSTRLWNPQTGELLATLVSLNNGDDWLVVTPDGAFDGSPGGWNQILWRFSSRLLDVSPVEIFFNEYYHPGLLPEILAGKKIVVAADVSQRDRRQPKLNIELEAGQRRGAISERALKLRVNVTDAPAGAQDVRLFRNGLLVRAWRGDVMKDQTGASLDATVSISAGRNQFTAYAFNRDNVKSADATLVVDGADSLKRAGTLHLLAVGINEYANSDYNLRYASADARAFGEEVERQQRKVGEYSQIEVTSLLDREATRANVLYALHRLAGKSDAQLPEGAPAALEKIRAAEPEDAVVVYYAGHGTAQGQRFYLIPHDLGYKGGRTELDEAGLKLILSHSISDLDLERAFERIDAGHLLMVIDACNSGQALEAEEKRRGPMNSKGLAQLAYEKGMYVLTAAQSYQAAMEAEQLGHGYLTYALVEEGLKSAAADDEPKDGQVLVREWLDYATDRVPAMQEAKMKQGRGLKHQVAFVEGEQNIDDVDKRSLQRPRVFYRREAEPQPLVVAKP